MLSHAQELRITNGIELDRFAVMKLVLSVMRTEDTEATICLRLYIHSVREAIRCS